TDAAGVVTAQRTSRVRLDDQQHPMYSISFKTFGAGAGNDVDSMSRFVLDAQGQVLAVDSFKLSTAQQAAMKTDIDTFSALDSDASGVGITQRGSRVRLDANQHPTYSVSFKTQGAGAGTDVDSLSKFILDSIGNVLAVDSFKLTAAQQAAIKTDIDTFAALDTDASGVTTAQRTSRVRLDDQQHPMYSISFKTFGAGAGSDVDSMSRFVLDAQGQVLAVDSFKLTTAQQAAMKTDIDTFAILDTDAAGVGITQRGSRVRLDAKQHPMYSVSFKTQGAGAGTDVDSLSKFILDSIGNVLAVDSFKLTAAQQAAIKTDIDTFAALDTDASGVTTAQRTSRVRLDDQQHPMYSISFKTFGAGAGSDVDSMSRFVLDAQGQVLAVDSFKLTTAQQAAMKTDIDTFAILDTDAAGVGITQRGSRVRLDANQHPMYSVSFKTQGAGAGTDVDSLSKFILDSIGNVLAVDSFKLTAAQQAAIKTDIDTFAALDTDASGVTTAQRTSRVRLDDQQHPMYSISFKTFGAGAGSDVDSMSRFVLDAQGQVLAVDSFKLTTAQQAAMKTDIDTFAILDTDAAGVGITQRGSRVRLDANQHPMYSVSFKTQGAGAGTDVDSLSKFILDSIGNVLAVDSFKLTAAQQAAIKTDIDTFAALDTDASGVTTAQRTSRVRLDDQQHPMYSISFKTFGAGAGSDVDSMSRFVLDAQGQVLAVDSFKLTTAQQAAMKTDIDTFAILDTDAAGVGITQRGSRVRLDANQHPMYSVSFKTQGAGAGTDVDSLSKFILDSIGNVLAVDSFKLTAAQQAAIKTDIDTFAALDTDASGVTTAQRTSRVRLDDQQHPMYSISFKTFGAGAGSDVDSMSRFVLDAQGQVLAVDSFKLTTAQQAAMKTDIDTFAILDTDAAGVGITQRGSRVRLDAKQHPMYSVSFKTQGAGAGTDVDSLSKFILDSIGNVLAVDSFKLTAAQQAAIKTDIDTFAALDTDASGVTTAQRTSRVRLDDQQHPMYSISFKTFGAGAGSDVDSMSRFVLDAQGQVLAVDSFKLTTAQQAAMKT